MTNSDRLNPSVEQDARPFSYTGRIRSVTFAIRGIRTMLASQHNAWIHAAATVGVIVTGFAFGISRTDWALVTCACMAVWTAEGLNTAVELLCDVASPEFHPLVEKAKDVAAGAVLLSAVGSVAIGVIVFGDSMAHLLSNIAALLFK